MSLASLDFPKALTLANTPTPLSYFERSSHALGVELFIKRDDLTGSGLSGNKIRKLSFLLAEAKAQGASVVITGGGEQSNHCRATAIAAARVGMRSQLCLRTNDPSAPPKDQGNILLSRMAGAAIRWISYEEWARQDEIYGQEAERLKQLGEKPYIVPEGGSNALGCWGYVECAREITEQLAGLPQLPTTVLYACGSGGTGAGLLLGAKAYQWTELGINVVGVNVCDDAAYFVEKIGRIASGFSDRFANAPRIQKDEIKILDGFVGRGYAKSRPEELAEIQNMASREGIFLDPVYSGKAWFALCQTLRENPSAFGKRIVFLHTGGIFGLFPKAEEFTRLSS